MERCGQFAGGTGSRSGSGCSGIDAGYSWGTTLWLGVIGGFTLSLIAVALWVRLAKSSRIGATFGDLLSAV
jgi:hypothetical protein